MVVPPHGHLKLGVRSVHTVDGEAPYNGMPINRRVHTCLPDPLTVRIRLLTEAGDQSICYQHVNPALEGYVLFGLTSFTVASSSCRSPRCWSCLDLILGSLFSA